MALSSASTCAKLILLGEHAVVYGYPALAMPFSGLRLRAMLEPSILGPSGLRVLAPDLKINEPLPIEGMQEDHPIRVAVDLTLRALGLANYPSAMLRIQSEIPFYSGLGSSAALAIAIIRAVSAFLGANLSPQASNALAYEAEKVNHGSPSGIDNTVISYEAPIYFVKGEAPEILSPGVRFTFLVADTGVAKSTAETVADLRRQYQADPQAIDRQFALIDHAVEAGKAALIKGDPASLGNAMQNNQEALSQLGLSCPELDNLIQAAMKHGALGAKLSGGGRGGHALVLIEENQSTAIRSALQAAGAKQVHSTCLEKPNAR